ncbi:8-amino-7-oxononanoate synthase [Pedobacter rhizosphaerae]|uniref:8-amino-7-oxononanoate synthase n=2 Tax=Pedobacter rhizosphaerae TaxID=390241 RepID=A0A1H9M9F3_9SPHI|nr:8-amino-7-oxononanoate synthase [Pedobacter rhizosphaerae]
MPPPIDFCSNDYLGFARSESLASLSTQNLKSLTNIKNGSGGSRLLSGNTAYTEQTEQFIAHFHSFDAGLIFNSGYDANLGLLSAVPQRGDTIITDELIHASIIDGCRLSHATRYKFAHNNLNDLAAKLKLSNGNIFVVVESVYSMDGDFAPLTEISALCEQYAANLIVDEAHAIGIFGTQGKGLVHQGNLQTKVFATVVTFGKALGGHGAIVLGSKDLRHYLINFSRPFIYTTATPIHNITAIKAAYQLLAEVDINIIQEKIALFRKLARDQNLNILESSSAIQGIIYPSNVRAKNAAQILQNKGFDVRAILSPTVPSGKERLRICIHTYNTTEEIVSLVKEIKEING